MRCTSSTGSTQVGRHVVEGLVAQDAGVVDDDVDAAERVERGLHDRRAALGRGDASRCWRPRRRRGLDLVDDVRGRARRRPGAVDRAAEVVDDDPGAAAGELERVRPAEAATGAGDDRDLAVETEIRHVEVPLIAV